jgi:hypothetical protein
MQGQVSFRPGSVEEWTNATLNYPLYNGDHLWTDQGAQTELHIGSTAIRMGSETALAILSLDDRMVQLSLTGGVLNVHLRSLGEGESFEIDTPNSAITLLRPGDYRVQADENNALTTLAVHGGDAEVTGGGRAFAVHARESVNMTGMDDSFSNVISGERGFDGFDRWCQDRDRREEQSQSVRYVGREMIGYEDLDANGTWSQAPEYGWVWAPRVVAVDWAPYRFGHWAWVEPWGWTWIDDAPWGFAPFHYGRWAYYRGGWVWVPGTVAARPVYAPALVAFVGGSGFSAAISFGGGGGVAWFPLGPREVYRPAYRVSEVYVRQVNITHVNVTNINVTNVTYVNRTYVTAVNRETFVSARPVHRDVVVVSPQMAMRAQVVGTAAPVVPERVSVLGHANMGMRVAAPPARVVERTVIVRHDPPPPPVSFAAKREVLVANPGRPVDPVTNESLRRSDRFERPAAVRPAFRTTGTPGSPQNPSQTMPPQGPRNLQPQPAAPQPMTQQPAMQQQQPAQPPHNDRPNFRRPQTGDQPQPAQPPSQPERPRFERQTQQQNPPTPQQPASQPERPRFERQPPPPNQPAAQPTPQPDRPHIDQRRQEQQQRNAERKIERKSEHKDEKKEEKKQ